jgi:hypothetical protein
MNKRDRNPQRGHQTRRHTVVTIGACNYPVDRDRDDPSNELQQRLRKQFDTCPR